MNYKEFLAVAAIILTFLAFAPYVYSMLSCKIQPHGFSWLTWGTTTMIVFVTQVDQNGGAGSWPTGVSAVITLVIAAYALGYKKSKMTYSRSDWAFLLSALSSIPLWVYASEAVFAIILVTLIDLLGFGPTFKKITRQPYSESLAFYLMLAIRNALIILALETYSLETVLFPAAIAVACAALIITSMYFRHVRVGASL